MRAYRLHHFGIGMLLLMVTKMNASTSFPPVQILIPSFDHVETNLTTKLFPRQLPYNRAYLLTSTSTFWNLMIGGTGLERVSKQSRDHNCSYAMNAGPFHKDASPVGWMISQGHVMSRDDSTTWPGFGKTWDGFYYFGTPPINNVDPSTLLQDYVTGFGWLVYQGTSVFDDNNDDNNNDNNPTGAHRAPRTAVGIDKKGRLMWLVVDGCQYCLQNQGPTLPELAGILVDFQVEYAINMDGGSSSVLVQENTILSRPTCLDLPIVCERPVASTFCIHHHHGERSALNYKIHPQ